MKYVRGFILLMMLTALLIAGCSTSAATPAPADKPVQAPAADVPPTPAEAAAAPAKVDSPWQVVLEKEVKQGMRMAAFLDENFGLTGGPNSEGKAQYTTNGGEAWTMADTSGG